MVVMERKLTFKDATVTIKRLLYGSVEAVVEDKGDGEEVSIKEVRVNGEKIEDVSQVAATSDFDFDDGEWNIEVYIRCGEAEIDEP